MDTVDKETRSKIMAKVGQKGTRPEMVLRRALHKLGLRYKLHDKKLPGRPDLVFPKYKAVIFVNGCFWHAHENCKYFKVPSSRRVFWMEKFESNKLRDKRNYEELATMGWNVIIVWECALKKNAIENVALHINECLVRGDNYAEVASFQHGEL